MAAQEPDESSLLGQGRAVSWVRAKSRPDLRLEDGFVRWSVGEATVLVPMSNVRSLTAATAEPEPVALEVISEGETTPLPKKKAPARKTTKKKAPRRSRKTRQ